MRQGCGLGSRRSHGQAVCLAKSRDRGVHRGCSNPGAWAVRGATAEGEKLQRIARPSTRPRDSPASRTRPRLCASGLAEHWLLATVGAIVLIAALVGGLLYWLEVRRYESTDDAFVAARSFSVASKVGGYVTDIPVTDNQHVNAGDLLAKIDERDYRIAVDQAQAQVAVSKANVANVEAQIVSQQEQIKQAQAQLEQAQAQLQFSQEESARAQDLVEKGAGTVQRQQQTRSDLQAQQANTERAQDRGDGRATRHQDAASPARRRRAQLEQSQAQLDQANLNLQYTSLIAAQSGRVVKLSRRQGHLRAHAGQSLMMFVPDEVWITANFKETQLTDMRPGQPVDIRIDAYPGPQADRPCRQRAAGLRHRLQPVAGGERDRQLRQGGAARAGEDRVRQLASRCAGRPRHVGRALDRVR